MFGKRLKEIRNLSGLTSSQVSHYLGISLKAYLMMEKDEYLIPWEMIYRLCELYGCEEKVFYNEHEKIDCLCLSRVHIQDLKRVARITKIYSQLR